LTRTTSLPRTSVQAAPALKAPLRIAVIYCVAASQRKPIPFEREEFVTSFCGTSIEGLSGALNCSLVTVSNLLG
jgi:hypothetical protein